MPEIIFIFHVDNQVKYCKYYTDYVSDEHGNLNSLIYCSVLNCWNTYRTQQSLNPLMEIKLGIIGIINDNVCSPDDKYGFDMYIESESYQSKYFINCKQIN
jgi:hypothetical protein